MDALSPAVRNQNIWCHQLQRYTYTFILELTCIEDIMDTMDITGINVNMDITAHRRTSQPSRISRSSQTHERHGHQDHHRHHQHHGHHRYHRYAEIIMVYTHKPDFGHHVISCWLNSTNFDFEHEGVKVGWDREKTWIIKSHVNLPRGPISCLQWMHFTAP